MTRAQFASSVVEENEARSAFSHLLQFLKVDMRGRDFFPKRSGEFSPDVNKGTTWDCVARLCVGTLYVQIQRDARLVLSDGLADVLNLDTCRIHMSVRAAVKSTSAPLHFYEYNDRFKLETLASQLFGKISCTVVS